MGRLLDGRKNGNHALSQRTVASQNLYRDEKTNLLSSGETAGLSDRRRVTSVFNIQTLSSEFDFCHSFYVTKVVLSILTRKFFQEKSVRFLK